MCGGESLGFGEGSSSDNFCLKVHSYLILGTQIGIDLSLERLLGHSSVGKLNSESSYYLVSTL